MFLLLQGDKTDNDHERMSPNSTTPKFSPPIVCSQAVVSESEAVRAGASSDPDLMRQLQEKDRRIQYLELKIQQLSQVHIYHFLISVLPQN